MNVSIFLAQALGIYFLVVGILLLVRRQNMQAMVNDFFNNSALKFLGAVIALILGILMVISHNIWDGAGWQTAITIIAWLTFLKGIFYLFATDNLFNGFVRVVNKANVFLIGGIVSIILGGWLSFVGFGL